MNNANAKPATARRGRKGRALEVWRRLKRNRLAMAGLAILALLFLTALLADLVAPDRFLRRAARKGRTVPGSKDGARV